MKLRAHFSTAFVLSALITLTSACGSPAENDLSAIFSGSAKGPSSADVLELQLKAPPDAAASALRTFREGNGHSSEQQHEAAYILARLLQNNNLTSMTPANGAVVTDTGSGATSVPNSVANAAEALQLFQEATAIEPLRQRAVTHAVECATASKNEIVLRTLLQQQIAEFKEPNTRAGLEYALASLINVRKILKTQSNSSRRSRLTHQTRTLLWALDIAWQTSL